MAEHKILYLWSLAEAQKLGELDLWKESYKENCSCARDIFGHVAICPQYFFSKEKVKEYNRKIEKVVNLLIDELKLTEGSDYEKELKIHDWICKNVSYGRIGYK